MYLLGEACRLQQCATERTPAGDSEGNPSPSRASSCNLDPWGEEWLGTVQSNSKIKFNEQNKILQLNPSWLEEAIIEVSQHVSFFFC